MRYVATRYHCSFAVTSGLRGGVRDRAGGTTPPHNLTTLTTRPLVPPMLRILRRLSLTQWILISMVLGTLVGWAFPEASQQLKPLSTIFLRMIKSLIAPLIFATLVVGIAGHGDDMKRVGRLALKSLIYFEIVTTLALFIGLAAVNLTKPGVGVNLAADGQGGRGAREARRRRSATSSTTSSRRACSTRPSRTRCCRSSSGRSCSASALTQVTGPAEGGHARRARRAGRGDVQVHRAGHEVRPDRHRGGHRGDRRAQRARRPEEPRRCSS